MLPAVVQELEVAISAAKQGKMADESLVRCMLKIDDELHLRQLQIRDVFCMLVRGRRNICYCTIVELT